MSGYTLGKFGKVQNPPLEKGEKASLTLPLCKGARGIFFLLGATDVRSSSVPGRGCSGTAWPRTPIA